MTDRFYRHGIEQPADFLPFSTRDVQGALGEMFLRGAGIPITNGNPIAEHLHEEGVGLAKLSRHWLSPHFDADSLRTAPTSDVIVRALGTSDFVSALTSGWQQCVLSSFSQSISGYRAILRELVVKNFLPQNVPDFGGISDLQAKPEFAEWQYGELYSSTVLEAVELTTHGLQFSISRQALVNDSTQEITALMLQLGNCAALHMAASVASTLEDGTSMSDGSDFFATAKSNLIESAAGGAPSVTTLGAAAAKLWRMPVGDHVAGVAPRFVVVPPEHFITARTLAAATYDPAGTAGTLPQGRLDVVCLPHLVSTTNWFLLGDPQTAPSLALLRLAGSNQLVTLEQIPNPGLRDGLTMRLRVDYKIARISRVGAVKIESAS